MWKNSRKNTQSSKRYSIKKGKIFVADGKYYILATGEEKENKVSSRPLYQEREQQEERKA